MTLIDVQEVAWDLDPLVDGEGPEGADRLLAEADERAARFAEALESRAADIGAETTEFTAWVTEVGCASGRSSADRIGGPDIQISDDTVMVTFGVVPLGGAQECQGNPPTAVTVRLPEPLGDRRLLDGGREPPAEPPTCANRESCQ